MPTRSFAPLLLALAAGPAATGHADPPARIEVTVPNTRDANGQILCALHRSAATFGRPAQAYRTTRSAIHGHEAVCVFEGIRPGDYAISVLHDENGNFKLDTNFLGMPKEGVGVSNDARGFFGPPKYQDAVFHYAGGVLSLVVKLVYL